MAIEWFNPSPIDLYCEQHQSCNSKLWLFVCELVNCFAITALCRKNLTKPHHLLINAIIVSPRDTESIKLNALRFCGQRFLYSNFISPEVCYPESALLNTEIDYQYPPVGLFAVRFRRKVFAEIQSAEAREMLASTEKICWVVTTRYNVHRIALWSFSWKAIAETVSAVNPWRNAESTHRTLSLCNRCTLAYLEIVKK